MTHKSIEPKRWNEGVNSQLETVRSIPAIEAEIARLEQLLDERTAEYHIFGQTPSDRRHDIVVINRLADLRRELKDRT